MLNKVNILHLSDLHITDKYDSNVQMIEDTLVADIADIITKKNITLHAILITGDIINRGEATAYKKAKTLLEEISVKLAVPKEHIIMVPGNHDIPRNAFYPDICKKATEDILSNESCIELWDTLSPRFSNFSNFSKEFYMDSSQLSQGIGIRELKINNHCVHFYLLNTSWLSHGNEDFQKLAIGKWQYESLINQKKSLNPPDLVITMTHHPLSWLTPNQLEMAEDFLFNKKKLGTDLLLHGHVHNAKLQVLQRPDHSIAELTSGIGYPEYGVRVAGQNKVENCRYSIYEIDPKMESICCICRKSTNRGTFVPDTALYESDNDSGIYNLLWKSPTQSISSLEASSTIAPPYPELSLELDPVPFISGWCGRKQELEQLVKKEYRVILISGVGGQGKTGLASEYLRRMKTRPESFHACLWVDFRELQDTMQLKLQQLLEVMSEGIETTIKYKDETLPDTFNRFITHIRKKSFLIVFDNVDAYVTLESEEFISELHILVEKILNTQHESQILLTCRIPVYDSHANFINIKLDGLKEPEGIDFFKARGISLDQEEEIKCCKKIIQSTKGHPWWLGLIAGQISTEYGSFKKYMEYQGNSLVSGRMQLQEFFDTIWNHLGKTEKGKISHNILRHLVEATTPLNQSKISTISDVNYGKTSRVILSLKKLGLIEFHEDAQQAEYLYQVHPLLREYIHGKYTIENQVPYVKKVLQLFLDNKIIAFLFTPEDQNSGIPATQHSSLDLLNSIETCLNSRNTEKAFELLCYFYSRLRDENLHKEYITLGCQIFKELNWEKEAVVTTQRKAKLLADILENLDSIGDTSNYNIFWERYDRLVEHDTISYSGYLSLKAYILWRNKDFELSYEILQEYEAMKQKNSSVWDFTGMQNLKGLVLREMGNIPEAMEIFETAPISGSDLGNLARCYQKNNDLKTALSKLKESITLLRPKTDLNSRINLGYAYQWMGEIYESMGKTDLSENYYHQFKECWQEYAPGLLHRGLKNN